MFARGKTEVSNSIFQRAVEKVLAHEGGDVHHQDDPGGRTRYGISQRAYPKLDIANLSRPEAITIYYLDYWVAAGCDGLPEQLAYIVFDAAVNSGVARAKQWLSVTSGNEQARIAQFCGHRLQFMSDTKQWPTFGKGWARRVADILKGVQ